MSAGPTPALARVHEVSRRTVYRVDLRARSRVYRRDVTVLLISELSRQTGVPPSTLRYYEQVGLLPPTERTASGYRLYDDHARQRLLFIEAAKRLRLSLASIGDLLTVWETNPCRAVKGRLRPALDQRIAEADSTLHDLQGLRDQLIAARSRLDQLPDRDDRCDPDCAFLLQGENSLPLVEVTEKPVACSLDADQYLDRAEQWREVVAGGSRSPVPGGVEVALPVERASDLTALILAEQRCCGFLDFALRFDRGTVVMRLTAPDHAQQIVSDLTGACDDGC
jgi:MerR family copper efflux transcriptional regulator